MSLAEKLKALRKENHYTQKKVAEYLSVSRSTIAGYETKNRQPSHEKLTVLAELFHVSVDYLLDDSSDEIELYDNMSKARAERYLLSHFHHLSSHAKRELLDFLQYLEQREEAARQSKAKQS